LGDEELSEGGVDEELSEGGVVEGESDGGCHSFRLGDEELSEGGVDEELSEGGVGVDVGGGSSSSYWSRAGFPWANALVARITVTRAAASAMVSDRRTNAEVSIVRLMTPLLFPLILTGSFPTRNYDHKKNTSQGFAGQSSGFDRARAMGPERRNHRSRHELYVLRSYSLTAKLRHRRAT
jgi:hypothetical protein